MATNARTNAQVMTRVTCIGAILDGLLGVFKIAIGWISQSHALIADGVHSLAQTTWLLDSTIQIRQALTHILVQAQASTSGEPN